MAIQASTILAVTLVLIVPLAAQSGNSTWTLASQRKAETQIANLVDATRKLANLPPLRRATATVSEMQLVCTAALAGKNVNDPMIGSLETYVTGKLDAVIESIQLVALGTFGSHDGAPRYRVYSDKDWPRFSVVVLVDQSSTPANLAYRIGIARRPTISGDINEILHH
jgi:hypothetical protein